jgi:hypothetical protein
MASPESSSASQAGGGDKKKAETINSMLQRLGIEDDEIDDLVFEEDEAAPKEAIKWMALARVHTTNFFSPQTFEQHMRVAWSPAKEIVFNHIEDNLFSVQCFCLGDWLKVDEGGPWLFRQNAVCIAKYDGFAPPESVDLNTFETWIQIHKLPIGYRKEALIKNLTERKVGKAKKVEFDVQGMGNFVRVRVELDARKVLARFVTISRGGQWEFYQIKYEKMPRFCGACGFMGHTHLKCGSGEFDDDSLKWGEFLKAEWETWHGRGRGAGGFRSAGRPAGFGGGRGRGREQGMAGHGRNHVAPDDPNKISWRHNALPYIEGNILTEGELDDTGSSPVKNTDMEVEHNNGSDALAKRQLELGDEENIDGHTGANTDSTSKQPMIVDGSFLKTDSPGIEKENERKRSKKAGADSPLLGSAGSHEESVRSQ